MKPPIRMENPLSGSFNRERTVLVFRQRSLEFFASIAGMALGGLMVAISMVQFTMRWLSGLMFPEWNFLFGALFLVASAIAFAGFQTIRFDVRKRSYSMRRRIGLFPQSSQGRFDEIAHLELAPYDSLLPTNWLQSSSALANAPAHFGSLYVVRLHWKDPRRAPTVLEHVQTMQTFGTGDRNLLNFCQKAQQYANALGVGMYSQIALPGMTRIS